MVTIPDPFQRTGEMGRRIAERDWTASPLGAVDRWSKSFQSVVGTLLGSRYPMILLWGPELLQFYNDAYIGLIGGKHPDALGRSIRETQAESWSAIGPMIHAVMSTGTPNWVPAQQLPLRRSGYLEESYFSLSYSAVDDDDGTIRGMLCVCSEVTEQIVSARRMQLLRELAAAGETRSPREAADHLGRIIGEHPYDVPFAALYLHDGGGALELCGRANLPASSLLPARVVPAASGEGLAFARAMQGETVLFDDCKQRLDHPGGPFADPVRAVLTLPIASMDPARPLGVLVAAVSPARALDESYRTFYELLAGQVSTLMRNALAFEQARERAEALAEIDRLKTTFFSNVSHEFRTPLTLILGPIENAIASQSGTLGGIDLQTVHRSALRLLRLVNSLLDFSRLEAGRLEARFEPTDLAMLTAGLAGSFHSLLESAGLKLVVDCPPLDEPIYVDHGQWEKIVLNLISNAFKFTFEGEIAVRLHVRDGAVELAVSDTGTGIPPGELDKIFERFHRVAGARGRTFEGTGIGLALVQELARQHGGAVRVESVVGRGSTFFVTIPTGKDHLPADRTVARSGLPPIPHGAKPYLLEAAHWAGSGDAPAPAAPTDAPAPARVLIADDNAEMREYLTRLLAPRWTVETAEDGQAALEAATRNPPDLILSDVMMPRLDGVALLRQLRAHPATRTIPIILLSARAGEEAVVGGLETGADDYLVKPFSARELLSRVGTHLEMAQVRRAATDAATELAETRAALLADLERKNKELEAFSYSVSHDLRAPLRSIDGFSQALVEDHGEALGPEGRNYLERVRAAAQRMGHLIDDLLSLSRVERQDVRREPIDLAPIGRRIGERLDRAEPGRAVAFTVREGLRADADPRLAEIVLENLLGNAWKFTAKVPSPRVELGSIEVEGEPVFFVKDNGAGFDATYAGRLFAPFQRLHSDAEFPGTGIGLATVHRIVDRHGGRVWAEGKVGAGATIFWTFSAPKRGSIP